jgi:hemolysin III
MPADAASLTPPKPLLRGVSHQIAFFASLAAGAALVTAAAGGRALASATVFAASVAVLFGASALYHRVRWSPRVRPWIRRIDHAAIFLLIAGGYTAFGLIVLSGAWRIAILAIVGVGVTTAIVMRFVWLTAPGWVAAGLGMGLGWIAIVVSPQIYGGVGLGGFLLLLASGLLFTAGSIVYALKRPDPFPRVFGFHEVFHAFVVAAVACQYASVAFFLVPRG